MKTLNPLKNIALGAAALAAALGVASPLARAEIPTGFFKGEWKSGKNSTDAQIYIKTVTRGKVTTSYGLIFTDEYKDDATDNKVAKRGAFFQVEEIDPGILAFTQLHQSKDKILAKNEMQQATYLAQVDKKGSDIKLKITPTQEFTQICPGSITAEDSSSYTPSALPSKGTLRVDGREGEGEFKAGLYTGSFKPNTKEKMGNFMVNETFPGVYLMRTKRYANDKPQGFVADREISGVAFVRQGSSKAVLVMDMPAGSQSCWYDVAVLNED